MNNKEAREIIKEFRDSGHIYYTPVDEYKLNIAIDLAIEALGNGWISVDAKEDEFTELLDMARRMQQLYRNGKFGLSDEEMTRATAHLDDLRRIPSPPKPKQP